MKKKVALFFDAQTENGKTVLEFLRPFEKRKSDIVGKLVLNWIAEHGAAVPVEWLAKGEGGCVFPALVPGTQAAPKALPAGGGPAAEALPAGEGNQKDAPHDGNLVRAGLAAFLGQGKEE